jgi:hypothetical protein
MLAIALDTYLSVSHDLGIGGCTANRLARVRDIPEYSLKYLHTVFITREKAASKVWLQGLPRPTAHLLSFSITSAVPHQVLSVVALARYQPLPGRECAS